MEFLKGDKIQAVDQNGHWYQGTVLSVFEEMFEIGFKGWGPEFNRTVSYNEIRRPLLPLEEQIRVDEVMPGRRGERKRTSNYQRQQLKLLKKGDKITVEKSGMAVVIQVDTFTMRALADVGGNERWINACDIIWKDACPVMITREKKCEQKGANKRKTLPFSACPDATKAQACAANGTAVNPELIIDGKSQSEEPTTWTGLPQSDASTFMLGQVICGKCYEISGCSLIVTVKGLNIFQKTATCIYTADTALDKEVTISVPVDRLQGPVPIKLQRCDSRLLTVITNQAVADSTRNMHNNDFRKEFRKEQLKNLINGEINTLLLSRNAYRRFIIGPATIDIDLSLFHLSPSQTESSYGYKKTRYSLSCLDDILGKRWDIRRKEEGARYITCLKIKLGKDYTLVGTISAALCRGLVNIHDTYRTTLEADINSSDGGELQDMDE